MGIGGPVRTINKKEKSDFLQKPILYRFYKEPYPLKNREFPIFQIFRERDLLQKNGLRIRDQRHKIHQNPSKHLVGGKVVENLLRCVICPQHNKS